jgi:dTDP-4-amino-4,6-dideoxygalactose transaminase
MIYCANPKAQFLSYKNKIISKIITVLNSGKYIVGKELCLLEKEFAKYIGTKYAIGVANGTDAIEIALRSLNIGYGDEVITVSHTAVATVAAIELVGAKAVLVDVEKEYFTLDFKLLKKALTKKTKAIIPVHLYGQSANMDEIKKFSKLHNLYIIEDVSQAHGASFKNKMLGSIGQIGCFSCYPTKNLGALGDAGLITTNNYKLYSKIKTLRQYGWKVRNKSELPGRNSRLDEIQAAIIRIKLKNLDKDNKKRILISSLYSNALSKKYIIPKPRINSKSVFHLYVIRVRDRKKIINFLKSKNIFPDIHYPIPVHMQPAYKKRLRIVGQMTNTKLLSKEILSLPIYPELSMHNVKRIINLLLKYK